MECKRIVQADAQLYGLLHFWRLRFFIVHHLHIRVPLFQIVCVLTLSTTSTYVLPLLSLEHFQSALVFFASIDNKYLFVCFIVQHPFFWRIPLTRIKEALLYRVSFLVAVLHWAEADNICLRKFNVVTGDLSFLLKCWSRVSGFIINIIVGTNFLGSTILLLISLPLGFGTCVNSPLSGENAACLHWLSGISLFVSRGKGLARRVEVFGLVEGLIKLHSK